MGEAATRWLQVVGFSGVGKTRVLAALAARMTARGERVGAIKFSHHPLEPDAKDTGRLLAAGTRAGLLVGADGFLFRGSGGTGIPEWFWRVAADWDWVLVEGGRHLATPKVVLGSGSWPPVRGVVLASAGPDPPLAPYHLRARLPAEAEDVAAWVDRWRHVCSMTLGAVRRGVRDDDGER
jgi:molybdopterin-guanine dinucleotide biosynthesis protein MobB